MLVKVNRIRIAVIILSLGAILLLGLPLGAAYLRNVPQTLTQPNGQVLRCFASGDENFHWLHDADGYPITQDPNTGYFVYAVQVNDELSPTAYIPGTVSPQSIGLQRGVRVTREKLETRRVRIFGSLSERMALARPMPTTGSISNIVIFIRFSDDPEFTDLVSTYEAMLNSPTAGYNSMYNYYREVSYNALSIDTTFYPTPSGSTVLSYQDFYLRNYYRPYNSITNPAGYVNEADRTAREMLLLKNAVDAVSSQVPAGLDIDADDDGEVDNVCFVVYGSPDGWDALLWPHMWQLYPPAYATYINSKQVWTFNLHMQTSLASDGVGLLCHEMFHSLGAPDLYHYSYDGIDPVSSWDLMELNQNPPQHMGAYMKYRYGDWIASIPEITTSGTYTLNPLTSATGNCYKIRSPNSAAQYFVLEYRRDTGTFESSVPGSGLLVYRINTACDGVGNQDGPPDEVYIYRPGGTTTLNGTLGSAYFSSGVGRTVINDSTNPSGFLANGSAGGLSISNVGSAGTTISFQANLTTAKWKGMAMVSCPVIPGVTDPKPIIEFSGNSWYAYKPEQHKYIAYPDQYTWFDAADGIIGRGFWARFTSEIPVPTGNIPDQSQSVTIHLLPGWNLIGQPFTSPINWDHNAIKVQVTGGSEKRLYDSRDALANLAWGWRQSETNPNTGSYYLISDPRYIAGATQALQPWQAYWVKAYKTCDITLPPPP